MPFDILLPLALTLLSGCAHFAPTPGVPVALYEKVAESFRMVAREDVAENGEMTWNQASGCAVEENGRHYLYTARHVVFDKKNDDALPKKFYATTSQGENHTIDLSKLDVPDDNHDAVRIELTGPICRELRLADRKPRYGETLFVFGDARGAGVMCADAGKGMAIGPLEFEHDVDTIKGMSGGPVVDRDGNLVGLCEKGRTTTAQKAGVGIKSRIRFNRYCLAPMLEKGLVVRTDPQHPNSPHQEYETDMINYIDETVSISPDPSLPTNLTHGCDFNSLKNL